MEPINILIYIVVIVILIYGVNFLNIKKTNNNYEILQKYKPSRNDVIELTRNKLPVILLGVIEDWYIFNENDKVNKKKLTADVLNENTKILDEMLTLNKSYEINSMKIKKNKYINLVQQNNVKHFLCLLSGELSIYLFNPEQKIEYIINENNQKQSKYSFWNDENINLKETKYMEINLGAEQIIHIPYGWWYCYEIKKNSLILNINSNTVITGPLKIVL